MRGFRLHRGSSGIVGSLNASLGVWLPRRHTPEAHGLYRGCSSTTVPPASAKAAPRFSRTRAEKNTTSGTETLQSNRAPLNLFASTNTLTRELQNTLRECTHGLTDARREELLAQLAKGSLRQLDIVDGKVVLLCVEALQALEDEQKQLRDVSVGLGVRQTSCGRQEAEFCARSGAHLIEEAAHWVQAQGHRCEESLTLRIVCAISQSGFPQRVALLSGFLSRLQERYTQVPDNLRLTLAVSVAASLIDDTHHPVLQSALSQLCVGEALNRGQFGSLVMTFADVVALLDPLQQLVVLASNDESVATPRATWQSLVTQLWVALQQKQAHDPAMEALSLENAVVLWQSLSRSTAVDLAGLSSAVLHRILLALPQRVTNQTCPAPLVARLLLLTSPRRQTAAQSPHDAILVARVHQLSALLLTEMLDTGTATAASAAPLLTSLCRTLHEAPISFWEASLVSPALLTTVGARGGPGASPLFTERGESDLADVALMRSAEEAVSRWMKARLEGTCTSWAETTAVSTLLDVAMCTHATAHNDVSAKLVGELVDYLQAVVPLSSSEGTASHCGGASVLVTPALLTPVLLAYDALSSSQRIFLQTVVSQCMHRWTVLQVVAFLQWAAAADHALARTLLRSAAAELVAHVPQASASQLGALMLCFGQAGVRNDELCQAVVTRVHSLLKPSSLSSQENQGGTARAASGASTAGAGPLPCVMLTDLAAILAGLAAVEHTSTVAFVDAAPRIVESLPTVVDPFVVAQLMAAYARMLIWDFRLFWSLADRLTALCVAARPPGASFSTLVTAMLAMIRMDVPHKALVRVFLDRVATLHGHVAAALSCEESVLLLSVLSRLEWARFIAETTDGTDSGEGAAAACRAVQEELKAVVVSALGTFEDEAFAEIALCLSRLALLDDGVGAAPPSAVLSPLTLRAVTVAATGSPMALAHLAAAFAKSTGPVGELFAIIAERTVATKNDISAATLGTILAAFAEAGVENDRLFIEVLPRVRYVADYGTPSDLTNVVDAYSKAHIWHYKLFSRIAERAVQVRHEFTGSTLARFLAAYARVGMRQQKLLVEMAPRVELLAELLAPCELASLAASYAALDTTAQSVFESCAHQAVARPETFSRQEAETLLQALRLADCRCDDAVSALVARFPDLAAPPMEDAGGANEMTSG